MVVYHASYVAVMYTLLAIDIYSGFWWVFPRVIAAGFVCLAGWNLAGKRARGAPFSAFAKRAGMLGLIALVISIATWVALGKSFVFFGVIHLIAVSTLLAYPLLGKPALSALAGAVCMIAGLVLGRYRFDFPWLAWLGFRPQGIFPSDYLPLLPWFAWAAIGAAAADTAARIIGRRETESTHAPKAVREPLKRNWTVNALAFLGRKSLIVYLVHLPLLYGLGWVIQTLQSLP